MIPTWKEFREDLNELGNAIIQKEKEPDQEKLDKVNHFFVVLGNILFLVVCLVFIAGGIAWIIQKYNEEPGLQNTLNNIPIHQKFIAGFVLLSFLIVLLRVLIKMKQYIEMYKLFRIYVIMEAVLLLHGFYKNSDRVEKAPEAKASIGYIYHGDTAFLPLRAALYAQQETEPGENVLPPIERDSLQLFMNGKLVTTYVVTASVFDRIEMLEKENRENRKRLDKMQKVEPVFIKLLGNIKTVFGF